MPGETPVSGAPFHSTSPLLGAIRPAMIRTSVDLPQPEGPRRATASLPQMLRLISDSTNPASWPPVVPYSCDTWRISIRGWGVESDMGSKAEAAAVISDDLEFFPQGAVNANDNHGHDQYRGGQFGEIRIVSGPLNERSK